MTYRVHGHRATPTGAVVTDTEMKRITPEKILFRLILLASLGGSPWLVAAEEPGGDHDPDAALAREQGFMNAISGIESSEGAYAPELSEQMLSLGLALQQEDRHAEAVNAFKRGTHLARVNNGLYCAEQIPMLQGQIKSHIALGQYDDADERQRYLYRVELRSMDSGPARANALIQQANWQYNAHQLGLGWRGAGRLMNMWGLYQHALTDIINTEGETSPKLLTPLYGMLRTQYLVTEYQEVNEEPGFVMGSGFSPQSSNGFYSYRSQTYDKGRSVILAIYNVQQTNHGEDSVEAIAALVMLGDWALWHGKRDDADQIYRQAITELEQLPDAKEHIATFFAEPAMLPDINGLRPLPAAVSADEGNILVEFGVDSRGRVVDLLRLDENEDSDAAASRLMRGLRKTHFRPRFSEGEPVATEKLVRAYDIQ